jgi:ribosomal protein S18
MVCFYLATANTVDNWRKNDMCLGLANGYKEQKMADEQIINEKIKAIYPHIVVGGDIDKPCYNIHWYDIEQKTMICGFSSYKLELVRKWLEEEFEIVERDIDGLLNHQQRQLDNYSHNVRNMAKDFIDQQKIIQEQQSEIKRLNIRLRKEQHQFEDLGKMYSEIRAEVIKDLEAKIYEKLHEAEMHGNFEPVVTREMFDSVVKEMVGEQNDTE